MVSFPPHFCPSNKCTTYLTLQTYAFYAGIFLMVVSRLPFNNMRPGGFPSGGPGKRHKNANGSNGGEDVEVTFEDVAGVDEAKEELQEIVVRLNGIYTRSWL